MIRQIAASASRSVARSSVPRNGSFVQTRLASGHGPSYNQPTGYLFGEKPPAKGEKRVKGDWENMWLFGMMGGLVFAGVVNMYKPDTTLQSKAMVEAKKRLEESGETWRYKPSPNSGHPNGI